MLKQIEIPARQLCVCIGLMLCCLAAVAQSPKPIVIQESYHDVSMPLRDLEVQLFDHTLHEMPVGRIPVASEQLVPIIEDPVLQRDYPPVSVNMGLNFDGVGQGVFGFSVNSAPPDTDGAIGASQYVQWVNTSYAVFDKSTGNLVKGPLPGNAIWTGFAGNCAIDNDGDPIAQYDKAANRWVLTQFSVSRLPNQQCIAVSTTSDATGTYNRYAFNFTNFPDYPKLGVWPDAYYMSFNMFAGNTFVGPQSCAFDRSKMLAGQAATAVCFQNSPTFGSMLPSDLDGSTPPPAGSPDYFVAYNTNELQLWQFHVDFTTPTNSTFTGPVNIPVAAFNPLCGGGTCVPQTGTPQTLDSLADRLMYRFAYRNFGDHESLVVNHAVAVSGGGGGIRWYEIRSPGSGPTIFQQGTFAPDTSFRWMGSIAMDKAGDIAVGYSVSSNALHPEIHFTGRAASDPVGTMQTESIVINGTGSQNGGLNRWGDYSAMTVDPVDDCTFWYTNEYLKNTGSFNWNTRINNFSFPGCSGTTNFTLNVTLAGTGSGTVTSSPAGINCGTSCSASFASGTMVTLTAAADSNSTFAGWSGAGCTGTGSCMVTMNQAQSVTATFNASNFTLNVSEAGTGSGTVSSNPAGISCPGTCSASFASGTMVTLTAAAGSSSTFAGWSGAGCTGTGLCTVTMNQAQSVTATFNSTSNNFTLTVSKAGTGSGTVISKPAGINCGATCSASYANGTMVTLKATAASGSTFAGWSGACSGTGNCTVTMNQAQSVTATFNTSGTTFTLTVTKSGVGSGTVVSKPSGINCGTTCSANFAGGSIVTLRATPATGSTFGGWSGACSGTATTCNVTMSAAETVNAQFN